MTGQSLVEQADQRPANLGIGREPLAVGRQLLVAIQKHGQSIGTPPTTMLVGIADVLDQLPPVFFARGDFSEECPDPHDREHDQGGNDEQLHDEPGGRRLHRRQNRRRVIAIARTLSVEIIVGHAGPSEKRKGESRRRPRGPPEPSRGPLRHSKRIKRHFPQAPPTVKLPARSLTSKSPAAARNRWAYRGRAARLRTQRRFRRHPVRNSSKSS